MASTATISTKEIWKLLDGIMDPEIPVLSIIDLGIVRDVILKVSLPSGGTDPEGTIIITPTYSGCPAMDIIKMEIQLALLKHGYKNLQIKQILSPAWTTDWISEKGKQKLKEYGIAPPNTRSISSAFDRIGNLLFKDNPQVQCPHCHSFNTHRISEFGSTACKAIYQCDECKEPFDHFKCH